MATEERWSMKGDYFENCNCEILCPCIVGGGPAVPTEGHCDVAFAFHIQEGEYQGVALDDLNFIVVAYTPGIMGDGDWTLANYLDERADQFQRAAFGRLMSGEIGGPFERWMRLTSNYLGISYCPISFTADGHQRSVRIPGIIDFNVKGLVVGRRTEAMTLINTGHPVSSSLALAEGASSVYTDHGMTWDNTGKNGHYSTFEWSWPR
ncbi:MAG: DUF1326 domain-containing protein [Chloroflexota bacterium]|nr:DUF1326 domain-containing protein [Chloroflexota bacterium]